MDFDGWLVYGKAGVAVADLSAVSLVHVFPR
jgi:hypothetical protein